MSQAEALYRLQTIDLNLVQKQQRLKVIDAALNDSHIVAEAQSRVNAAQNALTPLRTQTRNLELELQTNVSKTQTTEEQLYSGRVRNPKEMQDMQNEIAALKKWHGELEDKLLALMMEVETAESMLADGELHLKQAQVVQDTQQSDLVKEQATLQAEVKALQTQRTEAAAKVEADSLKVYTAMRAKKISEPISVLKGNTCTFCGVEETMAVTQQVRQGQKLVHCTNCERILVYLG
jgi:predicted  nucleic acid-binding Zn-ribbon protein